MTEHNHDHVAGESVSDERHDKPVAAESDKMTPEKLGELAIKFATETAYAAAGFASVVAEKAKEYYESQKKHLAEKDPQAQDPNFKAFVDSMPDQNKNLLDEVQKGYKDLAEKGRNAVDTIQSRGTRPAADQPGPFDINSDAPASEVKDAPASYDDQAKPADPTN